MRKFIFYLLLFSGFASSAQHTFIDNFNIKQSLNQANKLVIISTDSLDQAINDINGTYTFSISGFTQELKFNEGMATLQLPVDKSTFVYIKHENEHGTHSKLLYVIKKAEQLEPILINKMYIFLIPILVISLIFLIRKFIYIGIFLLLVIGYLAHSKGLDLSTYYDTLFDYLKSLVN